MLFLLLLYTTQDCIEKLKANPVLFFYKILLIIPWIIVESFFLICRVWKLPSDFFYFFVHFHATVIFSSVLLFFYYLLIIVASLFLPSLFPREVIFSLIVSITVSISSKFLDYFSITFSTTVIWSSMPNFHLMLSLWFLIHHRCFALLEIFSDLKIFHYSWYKF